MLLQITQQNDQLLAYQNEAAAQQSEEEDNMLLQVTQQPNQACQACTVLNTLVDLWNHQ